MPFAAINGTDIYYETHGSGFPLLYVHGGFGGFDNLDDDLEPREPPVWLPRFAEHFQVILYDRRSCGRSGSPRVRHTMELLASDGSELLGHLGHNRAHIWGTSAGGPIALEIGFRHAGMAATLVIHESAPKLSRDPDRLAKLRERIDILETRGEAAAYEAGRQNGALGLNVFAPRSEGIAKYAAELRNYSAYIDWDATERLGDLKMPVLIVYGIDDTVFPNIGWDRLIADKPNYSYHPVPGVDHGGTGEVPGTYDRILEFMLQHTPGSPPLTL